MKKIFLLLSLIIPSVFIAQVQTNGSVGATLGNTNYFLDASASEGFATSTGKLLGFPRVNLTQFQFNPQIAVDEVVLSFFDGAVVYNSGTGNSATGTNNPSTATAVTPGFYYFSNPNGVANGNVTAGVWTAMGGGATAKDVTSTEIALSTKINGAQLYAINGTFTASGTSPSVSVTVPSGMTGYYSFITYQNGKTFRREIYSFDTASSTNNVICGNGIYSEVLPAGTYNYVLEYFK
jgi:hypothetical protein